MRRVPRQRQLRKVFLIGALCVAAVLASPLCLAAEGEDTLLDDWHALYLGGAKAGYQHEEIRREVVDGTTTFRTRARQELTISRANFQIRIVMESEVVEDVDGRLIAFKHQTTQGPLSHTVEGVVEGDELVITVSRGANRTVRRVPAPPGLCPRAAWMLMREKGLEPGTRYAMQVFLAELPERDVTMEVTVGGKEPVQLYEVTRTLHRVDITTNILPGMPLATWVDDDVTVWLSRMAFSPLIVIEMRKVPKEVALSPAEPAELFFASLERTDEQIPNPRQLEYLELVLVPAEGVSAELHVPSDAYQQVRETKAGLAVTIRRAHGDPAKSYTLPYAEAEHADLLQPNQWLEIQDPLVAQMAREAVGEESDALAAARRIEDFVEKVITTKDMSMGTASAAETAEHKTGDCSEHAVLVAALARAAGIPSRVVCGLACLSEVPGRQGGAFGYHMWAEVYVGEWLPLDAALGGHDATHLVLARTDLNGPGDLLDIVSAVCQFLGKVKIEVVEARAQAAAVSHEVGPTEG